MGQQGSQQPSHRCSAPSASQLPACSPHWLYRLVTEFTWQRYTKKWGLKNKSEEELFDTLGQSGLAALLKGEVLISPGLVRQYVQQAKQDRDKLKAKLKDAGFLLLQYVGQDVGRQSGFYEFPHLTFQEYFAGRALAQQFLSEKEQEAAGKLVSKHQYKGSYGRTLSFMAGEVSRVKGAACIEKLLGFLEKEQEVVGLQHLLLQLRVLHEWCCMAGEDAADEMENLEDKFKVLASLKEWFVRAFTHVRLEGYAADLPGYRLLGLLKSSLQTFGSVARHAPGLLELFKEAVQGPHGAVCLAAFSSLGRAMAGADAEARDMLTAMAADDNEAYEVREAAGQSLSQAEAAADGGTAQGSLGAAMESASQLPEDLLERLRQAAKDAEDEFDDALRSARASLVQSVAAAFQEEFRALLEPLLLAAKDRNGLVRAAAFEALLKASLEELLEHYWSTPDASLIPYITPRLYHTPLVIGKSVREGSQQVFLYAAAGKPREREWPLEAIEPFVDLVQVELSQMRQMESRLSVRVDKSVWERYFGKVDEEPPLPDGLEAIMDSPCPFWDRKKVRDTHLLVLIPGHVAGQPLTLDYLGELIQQPQEGYGTKYSDYWSAVRESIGRQASGGPYWVLMTRDVLPGSRNQYYEDQCALVARHQGYTVPGALEAAVVMLLHYVRSGERLYSDNPWTYTRCRDMSMYGYLPAVGGFSSGGLCVNHDYYDSLSGVAVLRKF